MEIFVQSLNTHFQSFSQTLNERKEYQLAFKEPIHAVMLREPLLWHFSTFVSQGAGTGTLSLQLDGNQLQDLARLQCSRLARSCHYGLKNQDGSHSLVPVICLGKHSSY